MIHERVLAMESISLCDSVAHTASGILDVRLCQASLPATVQCEIINVIWGCNLSMVEYCQSMDGYATYIRYYYAQCSSLTRGGRYTSQTHGDLMKIVRYVQARDATFESVMASVCLNLPGIETETIRVAMLTAARLWLMLYIGEDQFSLSPGQLPISWDRDTLRNCVRSHFKPQCILTDTVRLEKNFNAVNLDTVGNIQVVWTNNLADHLLMISDDTRVSVFHHATFLLNHRDKKFDIYEDEFIKETLYTLALLFPESDKKTKAWFLKKQAEQMNLQSFLDSAARKCGNLNAAQRQIHKFNYWRERLIILKTVFDESNPKTLKQMWKDRRKGERWFTFWVAMAIVMLTVIFGLAQTIEGAIQVFKAYHPS